MCSTMRMPSGHGRFYGSKKTPMAGHVKQAGRGRSGRVSWPTRLQLLADGMDAQVLMEDVELVRSLKGKPIPEGSSLGGEYIKALYADAAATAASDAEARRRKSSACGAAKSSSSRIS